ncbi:MAG: bifunctional sugar-1-phosphate nucleotidylyltransferase/acetyltransferase [Halobacteriota archaeon]|nr:bifunctional sugar-1-phosphate nucleotidylyltransferase/acetyltransferase [Halobacteriota archaeon]
MKAVILAAGEGVRLRPFTIKRPKVMVPLVNKPILEYVIRALSKCGIYEIVLVVGYKKESVMDYFGSGDDFGVNIVYVEQTQQLGTAHAIKQASELINEDFLVLNGDNLIEPDAISDLIDGYCGNVSILTVTREDTEGYGVVLTDGDNVTEIIEKPDKKISDRMNTGTYILPHGIFKEIEETPISLRGEYDITTTLEQMIKGGIKVMATNTFHGWADAAYPWDLLKLNSKILGSASGKCEGEVEEGVTIKGEVVIGKDSIIRTGSYIIGPVVIGSGCEIGPNVTITPSTSIGNNVYIQPYSVITNSVLMNDVRIGSNSFISSSIFGENVKVSSGFVTEHAPSNAISSDEIIPVDIGTIIGENSKFGCRTVTKAGCIIGINCEVESGKIVLKNLPNYSIVL